MNGKATAETIKMLVQANNTIADVLEMLAVESKRLENKGLPTEDIEELDKVRNRLSVMRYDFTDAIGKLAEANANVETVVYKDPDGNKGVCLL